MAAAPPRAPTLAGSVIRCEHGRRWLVSDRLLGSGGFAKVYECTNAAGSCADGERAAVKVIDLRLQSLWAQGKLRSESECLRRAQGSDYIVSFFGEVRHGPFQIFVLEAWGQSDLLEEVLKRQGHGLGEARARGVLGQLLEALSWLHSRRICHGDVKPENLLCSRRDGFDRVKLADFGSAMLLPPEGCAAVDPVAQGTTLYSPPEVLLGKTYSYAADMWATGITTYVLVSGNFPFGSTADALSSSASFDGEAWAGSPRPREFISALLLHEPSLRPTATQARRHAWLTTRSRTQDPLGRRPPPPPLCAPPPTPQLLQAPPMLLPSSVPPLVPCPSMDMPPPPPITTSPVAESSPTLPVPTGAAAAAASTATASASSSASTSSGSSRVSSCSASAKSPDPTSMVNGRPAHSPQTPPARFPASSHEARAGAIATRTGQTPTSRTKRAHASLSSASTAATWSDGAEQHPARQHPAPAKKRRTARSGLPLEQPLPLHAIDPSSSSGSTSDGGTSHLARPPPHAGWYPKVVTNHLAAPLHALNGQGL